MMLYTTDKIRHLMGNISQSELTEICVASGSDYSDNASRDIYKTMSQFKEWQDTNTTMSFYQWLTQTYQVNTVHMEHVLSMYAITDLSLIRNIEEQCAKFTHIYDKQSVVTTLNAHGFILPLGIIPSLFTTTVC